MKDFVVKKIKSLKRKPSLVLPLFNFNVLKIFKPSFAVALVTIILITSLATVGVIGVAQNSLPGDFLYPLKTAFEQTRLTFTPGQANKTKLSIKLATERIDEFTQIVNEPEKKKDVEKTIKSFTAQIVNVREGIDKLKEKNAEKAAEVAKIVESQTPIYEETLIESSEQLSYIIPEQDELKKNIDEALIEVSKTEEATKKVIEESDSDSEEPLLSDEDIVIPIKEEGVESPSMEFENLNQELPLEEEPQEEE
jgi:hypothetical protein